MKMAYLLGAAVAVAAGLGYADHARTAVAPVPVAEALGAPVAAAPAGDAPSDGSAISGRVLETIDVEKYTYLRLATAQGEAWAAVSKASIARGESVTIEHAARMEHFASTTLKRTFDVIYFGSLAGAEGSSAGLPNVLLNDPSGALPPGHPSIGQGAMPANDEQDMPANHPSTVPTSEPIAVPKLARAEGSNGHVIVDLFANKERLVGKRVRVRGMVTKATLDVLGATFLHVRDGSGDTATKTNDLAVTTSARPAIGDVLVLEGVLRLDADLGTGYRYPALLEKASVVKE